MALLKNTTTNEVIALQIRHLFGRDRQWVDTCLAHSQISPIQGAIRFDGQAWRLKDLSGNAIDYNGQQVDEIVLNLGGVITFTPGNLQQWRVINLDPPKALLRSLHTEDLIIELNQNLTLPQVGSPHLQIKRLDNGLWACQQHHKNQISTELTEGAVLCAGEEVWQFSTSSLVTEIVEHMPAPADKLQFHFQVSQDEEHVAVKVKTTNQTLDMGERVHHYPLLLLARKRRDDSNNGYDELAQGWVDIDDFKTTLGIDSTVLNMQIYRARCQLSKMLPSKPAQQLEKNLVERRPGQLRFGFSDFKICRGMVVEG